MLRTQCSHYGHFKEVYFLLALVSSLGLKGHQQMKPTFWFSFAHRETSLHSSVSFSDASQSMVKSKDFASKADAVTLMHPGIASDDNWKKIFCQNHLFMERRNSHEIKWFSESVSFPQRLFSVKKIQLTLKGLNPCLSWQPQPRTSCTSVGMGVDGGWMGHQGQAWAWP